MILLLLQTSFHLEVIDPELKQRMSQTFNDLTIFIHVKLQFINKNVLEGEHLLIMCLLISLFSTEAFTF